MKELTYNFYEMRAHLNCLKILYYNKPHTIQELDKIIIEMDKLFKQLKTLNRLSVANNILQHASIITALCMLACTMFQKELARDLGMYAYPAILTMLGAYIITTQKIIKNLDKLQQDTNNMFDSLRSTLRQR